MHSLIFNERLRSVSHLIRTRILARSMGGGPRTFPGGLNKWQWKRLHEKKAKEKETRLLDQEKQLYEARIRSEIRAKLWAKPDSEPVVQQQQQHGPMTPKEHIKALADRFMKAGAEDLWNEDDGPISEPCDPPPAENRRPGPEVRNLISGKQGQIGNRESRNLSDVGISNYVRSRNYSSLSRANFRRNSSEDDNDSRYKSDLNQNIVSDFDSNDISKWNLSGSFDTNSRKFDITRFGNDSGVRKKDLGGRSLRKFTRNESSCSEDDTEVVFNDNKEKVKSKNASEFVKNKRFVHKKFRKNDSSSSDDESDEEDGVHGMAGKRDVTKMGSIAALGKYDMKTSKRIPLKNVEQEIDSSRNIETIREEIRQRKVVENEREPIEEESIYTEKRFDECGISPLTVKALSASGYVQMTRVQDTTLSLFLEGMDALVKAKTGTGKTAAFLLPAIETVLKATKDGKSQRVPPVFVLILCPTRELASQLAAEAKALLKYHEGIGLMTLVGGTRFKVDQQHLESDPCQMIIATPGRLLDHIENKSGITVRLMGLKMLVLDEADRLLDLGFRKDVEKIVDCLPRQRHTLLFSATIPKEVRRISQLVLKRDHAYIDTAGLGCVETPAKILQSCLVAPHELHFQIVHHLLKEHLSQVPDYKVVVFCSTGMVTSLLYLLLREMKMNVREIHTRKPQLYRTRVSEEFRDSKRLILVTSDVTARGMNYPDVTLVIQVGIPSSREQYIHRLGRTGREGKEGEGILLLAPWERYFLDDLRDLPLETIYPPQLDPEIKHQIDKSMSKIDGSVKEAAYHAWLGYYNSIREIGRDKTTLVELAKRFCDSIGLENPPSMFRKTALKMGLKDIPGIKIRK